MIDVYLHGTNNIQLGGDDLDSTETRISLHQTGWSVRVCWDRYKRRPLLVKEHLERKEVLPTLKALLAEYENEDEIDLNEWEINSYLDVVTRTCRKVYAEPPYKPAFTGGPFAPFASPGGSCDDK